MRGSADRAIGVLLGLAAGDRIGGPLRMAFRVAGSLRDRRRFDAADIGSRYLQWWREGAFDTGPTVARVLSLVAAGAPFEAAARRVHEESGGLTAGCNPAHRIAPLAMCAAIIDSEVGAAAVVEAGLTHRHPLAGDAAAAIACLCRALIRGVPWPAALRRAAEGRGPETCAALEVHPHAVLSRGGFAPDALAAAIHFVHTAASFPAALARSIDFAGPANFCPVLVGSIGGARWGSAQIEESALRHHGELVPRVGEVALTLGGGWPIGGE